MIKVAVSLIKSESKGCLGSDKSVSTSHSCLDRAYLTSKSNSLKSTFGPTGKSLLSNVNVKICSLKTSQLLSHIELMTKL